MNKKVYIIDGNSLTHRAYHAMRPLTNGDGFYTHAIYGFLKMLLKLIREESPDGIAVAFDVGKTFRHDMYADYKGTRKKTDEELRMQFPVLRELLQVMGIPVLTEEGYEADDILGTMSCRGKEAGDSIVLVTGDKDILQLIDDNVRVMLTRKGLSQVDLLDREQLLEEYEITPEQVKDMKGLQGDPSDNIKGVPGIGAKTALKLITEYGDIEGVYEHIDELKGKVKENLITYKEDAFFSRTLATIECNVPMEYTGFPYGCSYGDKEALMEILTNLSFKSMVGEVLNLLDCEGAGDEVNTLIAEEDLVEATTCEDINEFTEKLEALDTSLVIVDYEVNEEEEISRVSLFNGEVHLLFATDFPMGMITTCIINSLEGVEGKSVFFETKRWYHLLLREGKEIINRNYDDLSLMAYVIHPDRTYTLPSLIEDYMGNPGEVDNNTQNMWHIYTLIKEKMEEGKVTSVYETMEKPLAPVLAKMEYHGVGLDAGTLEEMEKDTGAKIEALKEEIYKLSGEEFNINSPQQLGKILFEKLELPAWKKTKTGYSTNQEVLDKLYDKHPIIPLIFEYRKLSKLYSTYIMGLLELAKKDPVVHTTYNQTVAVTGRLSSENPNLQNIPIRLPEGRLIRKAFIPVVGENYLLSGDYSQIELRILAHMSGDENMLEAFRAGVDIHTKTASEVFNVSTDEVTSDMRRKAKAVNFGIVYGLSSFGLSRDLDIPIEEAKDYIETYFLKYPKVRQWIDQTLMEAKETLKVYTLTGRYREIPDLASSRHMVKAAAERMAMNAPIQGTAADLIKLAMIEVDQALKEGGFKGRMILQVHDELIFEVPEEEIEVLGQLMQDKMTEAMSLDVPLVVDLKVGKNWYDMRSL